MNRKTGIHLQGLKTQIRELEDEGLLDSGQAAAARRKLNRMSKALTGMPGHSKARTRFELHKAVEDLIVIVTTIGTPREKK